VSNDDDDDVHRPSSPDAAVEEPRPGPGGATRQVRQVRHVRQVRLVAGDLTEGPEHHRDPDQTRRRDRHEDR